MPRRLFLGAFHPQLPLPGRWWWWRVRVPFPLTRALAPAHAPLQTLGIAQPNHCLFSEALARQTHTTESQAEPLPTTATQLEYKTDPLPVSPPEPPQARSTRTLGQTGALVNQNRGWHSVGHSTRAQYFRDFVSFYKIGPHASRRTTTQFPAMTLTSKIHFISIAPVAAH